VTVARNKRAQRPSSKSARSLVRTRTKGKSKNRKRPYPLRLADKLAQLRNDLGLSQTEIAARIGVDNRASISGYERGEREPPLPTLLAYARLAGVSVESLIDDKMSPAK
jgi:DNA-binding XRE family transcriptional regulator